MLLHRLLRHLTDFGLLTHRRIEGVLSLVLSFRQRSAPCPSRQHRLTAVRSSYKRMIADLPMAGAQVLLHLRGCSKMRRLCVRGWSQCGRL